MTKRRLAWRFACLSGRFTPRQMADAASMPVETVKLFIRQLCKSNRVELVKKGDERSADLYRILDESPLPTPKRRKKRPNAKQRIWNSCRMLKVFTLDQLVATADVNETVVKRTVKRLFRAKILRTVHDADFGEMYRLNVDLGVLPPEDQKDGLFAPSRQTFYPYLEDV